MKRPWFLTFMAGLAGVIACSPGWGQARGDGAFVSYYSDRNFALTADPEVPQWRAVKGIIAENDQRGKPNPAHRTEIRSRWSDNHLYLLFICPYEQLHLRPNPSTQSETNKLWDWDVAEAFIGTDFQRIRRYKEFQVSPQGEWVDLDIDRDQPLPEGGWLWNSGYEVKARIDPDDKIWYGEMKIPFRALDIQTPTAGQQLRINLYRLQGPPPRRNMIAWQPTHSNTYHVPEAFGRMVLEK
jgi:hypothetical protein